MFFKNKNLYKIDLFILISLILIILIGLVNLYSATISLKRNFMLSQIVATILGFVLMFILIAVNIKFLKRLYLPINISTYNWYRRFRRSKKLD